jgi:hypothetical protein
MGSFGNLCSGKMVPDGKGELMDNLGGMRSDDGGANKNVCFAVGDKLHETFPKITCVAAGNNTQGCGRNRNG